MKIEKTCEQCGSAYLCERHRADKSRFCCNACQVEWQRSKTDRRDIKCKRCADVFSGMKDHGAWPQYCSRACFAANAIAPAEKECGNCGSLFIATKTNTGHSEDGRRLYCSSACAKAGLQRGDEHKCLNCGGGFYLPQSKLKQRGKAGCCGAECQAAYYVGTLSSSYKRGAYVHSQNGETHLLMSRPGYVGKYVGEHRVVASRVIGRLVTRNEFVIRINRQVSDNRPENLFICESNSEFSKRRAGSLPWPTKSNLHDFSRKRSAEVSGND